MWQSFKEAFYWFLWHAVKGDEPYPDAPKTPKMTPEAPMNPEPTPVPPQPKKDLLTLFCLAIKSREGYFEPCPQYPKGTPAYYNHNPGNIRCGADKSLWNHLAIRSNNNFCVFPTYDVGFQALKNVITYAASGKSYVYKPTDTIVQFFARYSPSSDNNDPLSYAHEVAGKLGVDANTFQIKQLL